MTSTFECSKKWGDYLLPPWVGHNNREQANRDFLIMHPREFNFEVRHSPMPPDGTLRIP